MLTAGQVIRYGPALYRVDYVNECRARIVPLAKRHVELPDGREFEAERGGVNISPNSLVEIITNIELARDQIELQKAEAELAAAKAELERASRQQPSPSVTRVTSAPGKPASAPAAPKPVAHRRVAVPPGGGWHLADVATPSFKEGTLAEKVWLFIGTHPGLSTAAIVEGVKAEGAVAACVSRFHQAGLIVKKI